MKIKPIILAAGFSARFNGNKLLYKIEGKPMYLHIVEKAMALHEEGFFEAPLVVTQFSEISEKMQALNIDYTINLNADLGLSSSVKAGLNAVGNYDAFLFFTADQPYLKKETIRNFVASYKNSGFSLGCVYANEKTGNPAIFAHEFKEALLALEGEVGGKTIIKNNLEKLFIYEADPIELKDIDTKEDLKK